MSPEMYEELEAAAFAAWPALEPEEMVLGWRLRFANGHTKRANSANCTLVSNDLTPAQIVDIEQRYRQRGLPPIFRLTSLAAPEGIDGALAERGYHLVDPSWVMVLPVLNAPAVAEYMLGLDVDAWGSAFLRITGNNAPAHDTHMRMLRSIKGQCAFAIEYLGDDPVCGGLGVISTNKLGLFDIATTPTQRQKGWATLLCNKLLAWGQQAGAESAYLQVTGSNSSAIRVYEKLGFQRAYHYWYRVAPSLLNEH